jgi:hypothetical protein
MAFNMNRERVALPDVAILLLVRIDSPSRRENLQIVLDYLSAEFDVELVLLETALLPVCRELANRYQVRYFFDEQRTESLHRTYYNNCLMRLTEKAFVALYDIDILLDPHQITAAVQRLRNGAGLVYPYDGVFLEVDRVYKRLFAQRKDMQLLISNAHRFHAVFYRSFGGVCFLNREAYLSYGGENERLIGWCPDDIERYRRARILSMGVERVPGSLFHLWHTRGVNSGNFNKSVAMANRKEYLRICNSYQDEN